MAVTEGTPKDIIIPNHGNVNERGIYNISGPGITGFTALAGAANQGTSVVDVVQRALSENRITVAVFSHYEIADRVWVTALGEPDIVTGTREQGHVTVNTPTFLTGVWIEGTDSDNNANGTMIITLQGSGIHGNTGLTDMRPPHAQIIDFSPRSTDQNPPAADNPYSYDIDNNPPKRIIGVGDTVIPMIRLRFDNVTAPYQEYQIVLTGF